MNVVSLFVLDATLKEKWLKHFKMQRDRVSVLAEVQVSPAVSSAVFVFIHTDTLSF